MTLLVPAARSVRAVLLGACATLSLAACATVPDLGPKPQPKTFAPPVLDLPQAKWPADAWWTAYNDPQLTQLIEEALAGSPDMATAAARIRKADAIAQQTGAARYPSLTANGQATRTRRSQAEGLPEGIIPNGWKTAAQGSLQLSTELDLWGKTRASLAAATSEAEATRADAANARLALSTAVASAYAELAGLHADAATAAQALKARTETEELMTQRQTNGLETLAAVKRATANRAQAMSDLAAAAEGLAIGRNRLAALTGKGPERAMRITAPTLAMSWRFGLPADLGTELLGRRPDVVAARLRTEAAAKRIKAAKADFYPSVRLTALIGVQSLGIDRLTNATSTYGSMGPAISLPLFTGGALQGAYRGARADYDLAVAAYDSTLVKALNEVADAAVMAAALEPRAVRVREALAAAEDAYSLTLARYRGGLATYLDVLSAEDAVIAARRSQADLETRAFSVDIALVKALGGGFRDTPSKS
jgi:NodT family efflux transporter outer membrane factor (OMF) lipoprotein